MHEWLTTTTAANYIGCTRQNLYRHIWSGVMRARKIGRGYVLHPRDVAYVAECFEKRSLPLPLVERGVFGLEYQDLDGFALSRIDEENIDFSGDSIDPEDLDETEEDLRDQIRELRSVMRGLAATIGVSATLPVLTKEEAGGLIDRAMQDLQDGPLPIKRTQQWLQMLDGLTPRHLEATVDWAKGVEDAPDPPYFPLAKLSLKIRDQAQQSPYKDINGTASCALAVRAERVWRHVEQLIVGYSSLHALVRADGQRSRPIAHCRTDLYLLQHQRSKSMRSSRTQGFEAIMPPTKGEESHDRLRNRRTAQEEHGS